MALCWNRNILSALSLGVGLRVGSAVDGSLGQGGALPPPTRLFLLESLLTQREYPRSLKLAWSGHTYEHSLYTQCERLRVSSLKLLTDPPHTHCHACLGTNLTRSNNMAANGGATVIKAGHLNKLGGARKNWKKRWFVLTERWVDAVSVEPLRSIASHDRISSTPHPPST